jgi:hypothetical protein
MSATKAFGRLAKAARVSTSRLHDTRHTAATHLLVAGTDVPNRSWRARARERKRDALDLRAPRRRRAARCDRRFGRAVGAHRRRSAARRDGSRNERKRRRIFRARQPNGNRADSRKEKSP